MTLTTRLTLTMVILALSTAGVVGMLTYWNLGKAILPTELARLQAHVQRQGARLDEVISLARDDAIAFAKGAAALEGIVRARLHGGHDPQDGTTEQVWRMRMARRFVADLQAKPGYAQFRIIGVEDGGKEIVRVDRSGPDDAVRIVPDEELQAKGDREYFIETLKLPAGAVYLSKITLNQERGKIEEPHRPVIRAATPIHTPAGELFGIVVITVDLRQTLEQISKAEHPGGRVYVINQDGYYLLHPQVEKKFGFDLGRDERVQSEYPALATHLGKIETKVGVIQSPSGESLGVTVLPLRPGGGPWMALIEMVPEAELLAPLALVRQSSLVAGGVVALLAAGLALVLARSLTEPLVTLTRTIKSFSIGSLPVRVNARGEIGVLAQAFETIQNEINEKAEALRRSEHHFRALLGHSADGIVLIDASNKILYASPSVTVVEGYAPEELIGRNGLEKTHPDDLPLVQAAVRQLVANPGQPIPVLWRRKHKDGRWLWLEGVATNLLHDPAVGGIVTNYRDVTPRIEAEAALLRSQEEFKTLFDQAPFGYHEVDAEGRLRRINQTELDMLGYRAEELLGRHVWEISANPEVSQKAVRDKLGGQTPPRSFERLLKRKDGSLFPVLIEDRLVKREDGAVIGIRANVQDITEQKRAEEARQTSEGRYRTLFDYAPDGIVIADQQSYYLDANASMCRLLGYSREELIGLHASAIVAHVEIPHIGQALRVLKAKPDYQREWQFRRKDGSAFLADVIATKMPDGNLLAVIRDITERKRTEQAMRESEKYFRFLNDLVEATRLLADPEQIMAVMTRMLGGHLAASRCAYADVEQDGERFTILHDYTDGCVSTVGNYQLSLFGARAVSTLNGGQTLIIRDVEAELLPGKGADMFTAIGIKAIIVCPLVKNGCLRAMMAVHQTAARDWKPDEIIIVQDVVERCWATIERRNAEGKIRQLNVELEKRVTERTSQLEAANKELEAFSYSVSHDLRSPLRGIDGFARILREDYMERLDGEGRRVLDIICSESKRMGQLIDDLLGFSRMSRKELEAMEVDMNGLARSVFDGLIAAGSKHSPRFVLKSLPAVSGDRATLRQVFVNLLGNAIKFTARQNDPVIEVGGASSDGVATFYVKDNGVGFDEKYSAKLFGVFQRLHSEQEFEGTGVGLALVQRIIHRHGGKIRAEGRLGAGATFYFTLPVATQHNS